jgi:hypothetical protein
MSPPRLLRLSDWIVWLFFLLETVVLVSLVRDRKGYLADNWMNVAIILAGLPILWHFTPLAGLVRNLRLVLMLALLAQFIPSVRQALLRNHLNYTLLIAIVITVVSGILISQVDPAISSIGDGIWFAWVTVTTVGYGDLVPKSTAGRLIAGVLTFPSSRSSAPTLPPSWCVGTWRRWSVGKALGHEIKDLQAQLDRIEQSVERLQVRETDGQRVARIRKRP